MKNQDDSISLDQLEQDDSVSLDELGGQTEQPPVEQPSLLKEFGRANEQVTNAVRSPFIGSDNGKPRKFADTYSQDVMRILEGTPLKNHPNLEYLAYNTAGKASGLAGLAVDTVSEPYQILAGVLTGNAMKAISPLEEMMANSAKGTLKKFGIDLSNKRAVRGIAEGMDDAVQSTYKHFNDTYKPIFDKIGWKMVPDGYKTALSKNASDALSGVSEMSPNYKFLDQKLQAIIHGENLTAGDLQALKPHIAKLGRVGRPLNQTINDILGSKKMGGQAYIDVTKDFDQFVNNELPYAEELIYDQQGNVTSQKLLTGSKDRPMLLRTPKNLVENDRTAIQSLMDRPSTKTNSLAQLDALRKGTIIKRVVGATLLGAAAELIPQTRKAINSAVHILG